MNSWKKAAEILTQGGVVIIPSDSSFGIAALASDEKAIERVYKIKGREPGKPSLLIVGSVEQARELVEFTPLAEKLAQKYWLAPPKPSGECGAGGLTLVLNAKKLDLPEQIYGENKTLAVRLPDKKELQDLALEAGMFILPSANLAGLNAPFVPQEVDEKIKNQVDFFLDEPTDGNMPSTILDARGEKSIILRAGSIKVEERS